MSADLVYGLHAVTSTLERDAAAVEQLWVDRARQDARMRRVLELAHAAGISATGVSRRELDALAPTISHQGVLARCRSSMAKDESFLDGLLIRLDVPAFLLILDGVQDPHNLGACLRTADAAGVHAVIVPRNRAVSLTPAVRKVASGAAESVPLVRVTNLARTLRRLRERGVWLVGMAGEEGSALFETDLHGPLALIVGGEGQGLRRLTRQLCDQLARLPMAGCVESLNVSVATGIALYEAVRQRGLVCAPRGDSL